jgi:RND family efflux transporter MFP subunit
MYLSRCAVIFLASLTTVTAHARPLDCIVVPKQVAELAFGTGGVVSRLLVDRGDVVHKGDVLGYLDSAVEDANLAIAKTRQSETSGLETARAQLSASQSKFDRGRVLESKQIMSTSKIEEVQVEYESARLKVVEQEEINRLKTLDVDRAQAMLSLRRIVSPFDGVVVDRHVAPGEYVENKHALTIAQIDPVYADVIAPASMFPDVKKGQKVMVALQQPAGLSVAADAAVIDPYVDGASGTFRVRLSIANPDRSVVPGFRCRAEFPESGR